MRVLPILCGPFARATEPGGRPEDDPGVARFLDALSELAAREGDRLLWVLGVDLAHIGRRYGDGDEAKAGEGRLQDVAQRDRERLESVTEGDADGFWSLLREGGDDLRWCGASPLYTFLRAAGPVRGALLEYEQWNIDPESVVSFAAIAFRRAAARSRKRRSMKARAKEWLLAAGLAGLSVAAVAADSPPVHGSGGAGG